MGVHSSKGAKDIHYLGVNNPPPLLAITANGRMRLGSFKRGSSKKHVRSSSPAVSETSVARITQPKISSGVVVVTEMKTPVLRKQPPRRPDKHKLVRDHNRLASSNKSANDAAPVVFQPADASLKALEASELARKQLQEEHRAMVVGFDAMTIVVNHLVVNYKAFSTPFLKSTLETCLHEKKEAMMAMDEMQIVLERCKHYEAQMSSDHSTELETLRGKHEEEIRLLKDEFDDKLKEVNMKLETENQVSIDLKHEVAVEQSRYQDLESRFHELQCKERLLVESLHKDKDTRLQAAASRCKELQDEVDSHKTVLELRHREMHELRQKNAFLKIDADELIKVQKKASALQARVEDLEVQLTLKKDTERKLAAECVKMSESITQESATSKRLLLANEELVWKLNVSRGKLPNVTFSLDCDTSDWASRSLPSSSLQHEYFPSPSCTDVLERSLSVDPASLENNASFQRINKPLWSSSPIHRDNCVSKYADVSGVSDVEYVTTDQAETSVLQLSASGELSFVAVQVTVPKNSAGEAMVSEETSEEEENSCHMSDEDSSSDIGLH